MQAYVRAQTVRACPCWCPDRSWVQRRRTQERGSWNGTLGVLGQIWHKPQGLQKSQGFVWSKRFVHVNSCMDSYHIIAACIMRISHGCLHAHIYIYVFWISRILQADFVTKCKLIKERMESKEQEINGGWFTEEKLKKCNKFSAQSIKSIISYCRKFPESLVRLDWMKTYSISTCWLIDKNYIALMRMRSFINIVQTDTCISIL